MPVLMLELNEINFDVVRAYAERGKLPTLRRLIENPAEREKLAAGARAAAASFPSWRESATLFAQVLDQVMNQARDGVA